MSTKLETFFRRTWWIVCSSVPYCIRAHLGRDPDTKWFSPYRPFLSTLYLIFFDEQFYTDPRGGWAFLQLVASYSCRGLSYRSRASLLFRAFFSNREKLSLPASLGNGHVAGDYFLEGRQRYIIFDLAIEAFRLPALFASFSTCSWPDGSLSRPPSPDFPFQNRVSRSGLSD